MNTFNGRDKMLLVAIHLAFVALAVSEMKSYQNYKLYRVTPESIKQLNFLQSLQNTSPSQYSFWREPSKVGLSCDIMVPPDQDAKFLDQLKSADLMYKICMPNVQEFIDEENSHKNKGSRERQSRSAASFDWTHYYSLDEIYSWMDSLARRYPDWVSLVSAGRTYQGREIRGVKLNKSRSEKPGIFLDGGIHGREWISPATVTYLIDRLIHSEDDKVRALAEDYDWYIVPSVNPDGYVYSQTTDRLWSKTVSESNNSCNGANPNRNWDYKWNGVGTSQNPCDEDYGGRSAFSEVETRTLSKFIESIGDKLFAYISFQGYGQALIIPYDDTQEHLENYNETDAIGRKALDALAAVHGTKYDLGNAYETVGYLTTGSSTDWAKSTLKLPLVYTYGLRDTGKNGFLVPANQIIPNAEEVLVSLIAMFNDASKYGYPKTQSEPKIEP